MSMTKAIVLAGFAAAALATAPRVASADECLEVGWRDQSSNWTYYKAWVDEIREGKREGSARVKIRYDYHKGELDLKVYEKESGEGRDVIVMRGRWYEGRDKQRSGKVRLEMEKGHHRARGWYTYGDDESSTHFDFALRECKTR